MSPQLHRVCYLLGVHAEKWYFKAITGALGYSRVGCKNAAPDGAILLIHSKWKLFNTRWCIKIHFITQNQTWGGVLLNLIKAHYELSMEAAVGGITIEMMAYLLPINHNILFENQWFNTLSGHCKFILHRGDVKEGENKHLFVTSSNISQVHSHSFIMFISKNVTTFTLSSVWILELCITIQFIKSYTFSNWSIWFKWSQIEI